MSMVDRARQAAAEALRQAASEAREQAKVGADRAQKAAGVGAERAAVALREGAHKTAEGAQHAAREGAEKAVVTIKDPATRAKAKVAVVRAKRSVASALDRINPTMLANIVIRATAIQEQANADLRKKDSLYRISGIVIGASLPPSVQFQIARISDLEVKAVEEANRQPDDVADGEGPRGSGATASGPPAATVELNAAELLELPGVYAGTGSAAGNPPRR